MESMLNRARELARILAEDLSNELAEDISATLEGLIDTVETQTEMLNAAEFALSYYREPQLYLDQTQRGPTDPILDGGLRARTALALIVRPAGRPLPLRTPLPERH